MPKNPQPISEEIFRWQYQRSTTDDYTADELLKMSIQDLIHVAREVYGYPAYLPPNTREMALGWILQESRYDDIEFEPVGRL